jgi:hypothetical protein
MNATPALAYYAAGLKTVTYALRFGMALEGILRNRTTTSMTPRLSTCCTCAG